LIDRANHGTVTDADLEDMLRQLPLLTNSNASQVPLLTSNSNASEGATSGSVAPYMPASAGFASHSLTQPPQPSHFVGHHQAMFTAAMASMRNSDPEELERVLLANARLQQQLNDERAKSKRLVNRHLTSVPDYNNLKDEIKAKIASIQADYELKIQNERMLWEQERSVFQTEIEQLSSENQQLNTEIKQLQAANEKLASWVTLLVHLAKQNRDDIVQLKQQSAEANRVAKKSSADILELQKERDKLKQQNEESRKENEEAIRRQQATIYLANIFTFFSRRVVDNQLDDKSEWRNAYEIYEALELNNAKKKQNAADFLTRIGFDAGTIRKLDELRTTRNDGQHPVSQAGSNSLPYMLRSIEKAKEALIEWGLTIEYEEDDEDAQKYIQWCDELYEYINKNSAKLQLSPAEPKPKTPKKKNQLSHH